VIRFVPYTNQKNAIVFDNGTDHCKSYVGFVGGLQQIWLNGECAPKEIAHEILHALGFIHEQNRSDRDKFIQVLADNIDDRYRNNFERLPDDWMRVSGSSNFDFDSLMLYPAWMFAKNGQDTMKPVAPENRIQPGQTLSAQDIERLNQAYADLPATENPATPSTAAPTEDQ